MDNPKDNGNPEKMEKQEEVEEVVRVIFSSCDVDNNDLVPVSKLIDVVQPFMYEDLNALEDLRISLDPEGTNALVSSERFYEVMGLWSQKIAAHDEDKFDRSPSRLHELDEKELPYTHSTPRASLGDKLLKCKDLLNVSVVSGYSLSTSRLDTTNPGGPDKTVLEEEIKNLEHQLSKTASELTITKQQLAAYEDQNETLQQDLDRLTRRLHAEQQVNEHLQKEKVCTEELRDELGHYKKEMELLKKKLSQSEKDSMHYKDFIDEQDRQKHKLEKKVETLTKQHQDCLKEMFDVKTDLEAKEEQLTDIIKVYKELSVKLGEQNDLNNQLREENDILGHQKSTLEKALKAKSFNSPHSNLGNLNLDLSTTPPPHNTQNNYSPHYSSPNLSFPNGNQPKCQSRPLLRRVLARNSSTPVDRSPSLLDSSVPESVNSIPVLSPFHGASQDKGDQRHDSSEEDLYWKLQEGAKLDRQELNGTNESLRTEMLKADPVSDTYPTTLFERDEQIVRLEDELEKVKIYLKEIEDQKNDLFTKVQDQIKANEALRDYNFVLVTKDEANQTKIESLRKRIAQSEKNGVIFENDHENADGEIEDLRNKIKILEEAVQSKERQIEELKRIDGDATLQNEISELKEKLRKSENLVENYDQRLQATMRDLGEVSMGKVSVEEQLEALSKEKQNVAELSRLEELNKVISDKNEVLLNENFILNQDFECAKSKYEHLSTRFGALEEELRQLNDRNTNRDKEMELYEDDKKTMDFKVEEILRLKIEELNHLKTIQKQKDEEMLIFKENLEKKIVKEFEGKVKYSMDAEENILNLTQKCKQLEEDLKNTLSKLSSKSREFAENENKIRYLTNLETSLNQEIVHLKASNAELESTVANLGSDRECLQAKLKKINKIDGVVSDIQKHINEKDVIIEELKQLNKKMEQNLNEAQRDLREKIDDILKLRNEWTKNIDIKNDLWNRLKSLQKDNNRLNAENRELLDKERQLSNSSEALNIEYSNLLIMYDEEVQRNSHLAEQIAQLIEENDQCCKKYNHIAQELDYLSKFGTDTNQRLTQSLLECQAKLSLLETQNQTLQQEISKVQKNDNTCQTEVVDTKPYEEEFSKIKIESDKLLEELEGRLNEEVDKNKDLTKSLRELKEHLDYTNTQLLELKQKLTKNEADMIAKLQQNVKNNNRLVEELSRTKETLEVKDAELNKLINRINKCEKELKVLNEKNSILTQDLTIKCKELEQLEEERKTNEDKLHLEIKMKNSELVNKLTDVESLLEQRQKEMRCIENNNLQLTAEVDLTKREKDQINNDLSNATSENLVLKEKLFELENQTNTILGQKQMEISQIENRYSQLENGLRRMKQEKDTLSNKLQDAASELTQLKEKLSENEVVKNGLLNETKQKLQEEIAKNKAVFEKYTLLRQERDQLKLELDDLTATLSNAKTLCNAKQCELNDLRCKCTKLDSMIQIQKEQIEKSEVSLRDEINKNIQEKSLMTAELSNIKSLLDNGNLKLQNMEKLLSNTKKELSLKCLENVKLISDLEDAKRKWSESSKELSNIKSLLDNGNLKLQNMEKLLLNTKKELNLKCLENVKLTSDLEETKPKFWESFNSDASTCSNSEKDSSKRKTYSKQQIAIDKLKNKLEDVESQLKLEKNKNQDLRAQLLLAERRIINEEEHKKETEILQEQLTDKEKQLDKMETEYLELKQRVAISSEKKCDYADGNKIQCEGKTVNKFTLAARCPASPDSPSADREVSGVDLTRQSSFHSKCPFNINCDSTIEIPSLDINGLADDLIEELGLSDGSPRKILNREDTEKNVTALMLRLLINSNDISEKIEIETERYRCQYEEISGLIRDISHRLRDHVCIGTAEPIIPVFVLLEDIKIQLKEVVQSAGQVGVLIYEDRMKKCWNLVTNYMAMLRQENESLHNVSSESMPTQTGLRRRNKYTQDKGDLAEKPPCKRRRISCSRLTATILFLLGFTLSVSIIIHINCRMTASENQYCPLDGIITRINVGVPPM